MEQDVRAAGRVVPERIALRDEIAFVTGLVVGIVMSVVDIAVFFVAFGDWLYGGEVFQVALVGSPVAIVVLIVCGAITRRCRGRLMVVGAVLLVAPFVGVAAATIVFGL